MNAVAAILIAVLVLAALAGAYAFFAPRRAPEAVSAREPHVPREPLVASTDWAAGAGDEFAGLSEAARCDLVFAVATLDDERSRSLLEHALDDPAEAVALAAAHALELSGRREVVDAFLTSHPGERAERIKATLSLL